MNSPETTQPIENILVPDREDTPEPSAFGAILSEFEQEHKAAASESLQGTVISVNAEHVVVDVGRKMEGVLPVTPFKDRQGNLSVKPGDVLPVIIRGRNEEGYYELSTLQVKRPTDWTGFEKAFADKEIIAGTVTEVVKGGLRVDVGVPAFLPASRSGTRDPNEMERLVGQEIRCRITKLDTADEDVVVDRRGVLEEEAALAKEKAFAGLVEGAVIHGTVRTLMDFGAFVDLGGVDGLLHISDISWNRVAKVTDMLAVGDSVEVKVLKIDPATKRISLGMKQLTPDPWTLATQNMKPGDRIKGKVVRLADFGAFVEVAPGVDGLIPLSSMAWGKRIRKASDVVKAGDVVEVVVADVKPAEKRISLSLKEALGDPWEDVESKFPTGKVVEDVTITNMAKFGAFVDMGEGVEGMIHIADITSEKRLEHPKEMLAVGQKVRALVLEVDKERRRIRLGMKQLEPTVVDKFIEEHKVGEVLSGRVISATTEMAKVEVSEGIAATCRLPKEAPAAKAAPAESAKTDVSSLSAMLSARWKQGGGTEAAAGAPKLRTGEVRSFRITLLDAAAKRIEVEMA